MASNIMIEIIEPTKVNGKRREIGEEIAVSKKQADELIKSGLAKEPSAEKEPKTEAEVLLALDYQEVIALAGELGHEKPKGAKKADLIEFILQKRSEANS